MNDFYAQPLASIPQACGTVSKSKAAYEYFDNFSVEFQALVSSHAEATLQRVQDYPVVLAVQDTTSLNHSTHSATEGLGPIGTNPDKTVGMLVHSTLVFTPEAVPLGLLDVQVWARDPEEFGKKKTRAQRPIEEKESYKWLRSFQACQQAQVQLPHTILVNIGDRESDIYELFELALSQPQNPHLLIRAEQNRQLEEEASPLWDFMARQPVGATIEAHVPPTDLPRPAVRFFPAIGLIACRFCVAGRDGLLPTPISAAGEPEEPREFVSGARLVSAAASRWSGHRLGIPASRAGSAP